MLELIIKYVPLVYLFDFFDYNTARHCKKQTSMEQKKCGLVIVQLIEKMSKINIRYTGAICSIDSKATTTSQVSIWVRVIIKSLSKSLLL